MTAIRGATGWQGLFASAFRQSRNAMALVDGRRRFVDVNGALLRLLGHDREALVGNRVAGFVIGGPLATEAEWRAALAGGRFDGAASLRRVDGEAVLVQWAASTETATGRRLVLFVALTTSRWGGRMREPATAPGPAEGGANGSRPLSLREQEVVRLVAMGWTGREISDELQVTHETVRTHVRNAMRKTRARSRAHLVARSLAEGLVLD